VTPPRVHEQQPLETSIEGKAKATTHLLWKLAECDRQNSGYDVRKNNALGF
jgi:hypothetical protein